MPQAHDPWNLEACPALMKSSARPRSIYGCTALFRSCYSVCACVQFGRRWSSRLVYTNWPTQCPQREHSSLHTQTRTHNTHTGMVNNRTSLHCCRCWTQTQHNARPLSAAHCWRILHGPPVHRVCVQTAPAPPSSIGSEPHYSGGCAREEGRKRDVLQLRDESRDLCACD